MSSEWLKVMLDEIARKRADEAQARAELERRRAEHAAIAMAKAENDPAQG